ncbi:hypothetical protein MKW98_018207 [Papaver atlanticum]|uniref:Uncharacterized protein n=1 Tax=Papaver atlanticum TaxID=357466 RepID=A0AAD4RVY3_9MAGN|nr:hypothetical protein MKW98_018207 [Papaver atlanticum]
MIWTSEKVMSFTSVNAAYKWIILHCEVRILRCKMIISYCEGKLICYDSVLVFQVPTQTKCYHPSEAEPSTQDGPETQNTEPSSQHFMAYGEYASLLSSNSTDLLLSLAYESN